MFHYWLRTFVAQQTSLSQNKMSKKGSSHLLCGCARFLSIVSLRIAATQKYFSKNMTTVTDELSCEKNFFSLFYCPSPPQSALQRPLDPRVLIFYNYLYLTLFNSVQIF